VAGEKKKAEMRWLFQGVRRAHINVPNKASTCHDEPTVRNPPTIIIPEMEFYF
jgi:hypothetical protein